MVLTSVSLTRKIPPLKRIKNCSLFCFYLEKRYGKILCLKETVVELYNNRNIQ